MATIIFSSFSIIFITAMPFDECSDVKLRIMQHCMEQEMIAYHIDFKCYEANTRGPCEAGERLVLDRGHECYSAKCILDNDCSDGLLMYDGSCWGLNNNTEPCEVKE